MKTHYLFAYGTLMQSFQNPFAHFLHHKSKMIGKASFQGLLFDIESYPGAIQIPEIDYKVLGEVFQLNNFEETIKILDEYEGVGERFKEPNEYIRKAIPTRVETQTLECWVYLYNHSIKNKTWISSGDYYKFLKQKRI